MDIGTIPVWLALIAVSSVLQLTIVGVAAFMAFRAYRQVALAIDRLERKYVEPLVVRINTTIDEVNDVVVRAQHVDDDVRTMLTRVTNTATHTVDAVKYRLSPAITFGRGVWAAIASFRGQRAERRSTGIEHTGDDPGFAYGGGSHVQR